jgi:hypothetical protein
MDDAKDPKGLGDHAGSRGTQQADEFIEGLRAGGLEGAAGEWTIGRDQAKEERRQMIHVLALRAEYLKA